MIQIEDVDAAIQGRVYRADQLRERLHKEVLRGTLLIDTAGSQLAQINALSVIQLGEQMFGVPTRVSATARYGAGEVVDIEREVEQGGSLHSKGVLILSAYLGWRYAKYQPLSLSASLVFEQTYGGVDGDSASAAELCAPLSDVPIRQSLAITGAINQHGEVQAIGGVCQKIEGFFDICKGRGLNGDQGVIIPHSNVKDLMLRRDVIEAVEAGSFAVYAVRHVEEAMELLTGLPAGAPDERGRFPAETLNGRVQRRLAEWTLLHQRLAGQPEEEPEME
ncbi:MAG: S16 family serine protease [Candidatus Sedimenticola endophacoides]